MSHWECYVVFCLKENTNKIAFSHTIDLNNPDHTFPITKMHIKKGWLWLWSRGVALTTHNINVFRIHWRVDGVVLHFCLCPIQVANNIAFPVVHKHTLPYNPNLIYTFAAFQVTRKTNPKVWLWPWHKGVILTTTSATYSVSNRGVQGLALHFCYVSHSGGRHTTPPAAHKITFFDNRDFLNPDWACPSTQK